MKAPAAHIFTVAATVVTAVVTAAGFALFPHIADDLFSANLLQDSYLHGQPVDPAAYVENISIILHRNHFRLCNLLMPLVIMLPRWIPAAVSGCALLAIYMMSARIGRFDGRPLRMALYILALTVAYPWLDQLYLTSFQLPYLWGPAAALWLLTLLWRGKGRPAALGLLGYVLGFWHELPAAAILAAAAATWLRYPQMRTARTAAAAIGLALGIGTIAISFIFNATGGGFIAPDIHRASTFVFLLPAFAYIIAELWRWRRLDCGSFCLLAATVASTAICTYFCAGPRTTSFGTLCALAGLMRLMPARRLMSARLSAALACATLAAVLAHYVAVDMMCGRLARQTRYVLDTFATDPSATIFAPMTLREDASPLLLGKPYYDWWAHTRCRRVFEWMYAPAGHTIGVVPEELRDFSPERAARVAGSGSIYLWRGHTVAEQGTPTLLTADYGLGPRQRWYSAVTFRSEADGRQYLWLHPEQLATDFYRFHSPRGITF